MEIIKNDGTSIELVRFFEYQGKKYLIFSNHDGVDANGHVTIHICTVNMNNGLVATAVEDGDMNSVRNVIKMIVSENRNGALSSIVDLNYNDLNGINILGDWPLKMLPNYIDIIKMNQPVFTEESLPENNSNDYNNQQSTDQVMTNFQPFTNINEQQTNNNQNVFQQFTNESESQFSNNPSGFQPFTNVNEPQFNVPNETSSMLNQDVNNNNATDYEKMYFEQLDTINNLNSEIEFYKTKLEQLKNIINN